MEETIISTLPQLVVQYGDHRVTTQWDPEIQGFLAMSDNAIVVVHPTNPIYAKNLVLDQIDNLRNREVHVSP